MLLIIIAVISVIAFCVFNKKEGKEEEITEYTPVEEISQEQERQTIVSIYYNNIQNNCLMPEARLIDVKELARQPIFSIIEYANTRTKK